MTVHRIEPAPESTVYVFSAEHEPLLAVDPGDTVMVRSLDARGYLERHEFPGDAGKPKMSSGEVRGHCLNRPVAVRGAVPGDMLAVQIVSLTPDLWGWTVAAAAPDSVVLRRLGLARAEPGCCGRSTTPRARPPPTASTPGRSRRFSGSPGSPRPGRASTRRSRRAPRRAATSTARNSSRVRLCICRLIPAARCCTWGTGTRRRATGNHAARPSSAA